MVDIFPAKKRSWIMSRIKSGDTKPELAVRSIVHRMGFRYRLHNKVLPGKPDIVLNRLRKIILVHGCFWHQHKNCKISHLPESNTEYWNKKLKGNVSRDIKNKMELKKLGWHILVIWECQTKSPERLLKKLNKFLFEA